MRKTYLILTILYTCNTAYSMENSLAVSPSSSPYRSAMLIGGALTVTAGIGAVLLKRHLRDIQRPNSDSIQSFIAHTNSWGSFFYRRALQFGQDAISASLSLYNSQEEEKEVQERLTTAITRNNIQEVDLASKKLSSDKFIHNGIPHLKTALDAQHLTIAERLLQHGADPNPRLDISRLMSTLALQERFKQDQFLLLLNSSKSENSLNEADDEGKTLLHRISEITDPFRQKAVVDCIESSQQQHSYNLSLKDDNLMTPFLYAAHKNCFFVFDWLIKKEGQVRKSRYLNFLSFFKWLVKKEEQVRETSLGLLDKNGRNCLWWAVSNENEEFVKAILKQKEAENLIIQKDQDGISPLIKACHIRDEETRNKIFQMLLDSIDLKDKAESLALCIFSSCEVARFILAHYAQELNLDFNIDTQSFAGGYAHYVAYADDKSADWMELLDEHNIPIDFQDQRYRKSPLHIAVETGNLELVKFLKGKVNLDYQDHNGKTALQYAEISNHTDIEKELQAWSAVGEKVDNSSTEDDTARKQNVSMLSYFRAVLGI